MPKYKKSQDIISDDDFEVFQNDYNNALYNYAIAKKTNPSIDIESYMTPIRTKYSNKTIPNPINPKSGKLNYLINQGVVGTENKFMSSEKDSAASIILNAYNDPLSPESYYKERHGMMPQLGDITDGGDTNPDYLKWLAKKQGDNDPYYMKWLGMSDEYKSKNPYEEKQSTPIKYRKNPNNAIYVNVGGM